jgi:hypothetical protein
MNHTFVSIFGAPALFAFALAGCATEGDDDTGGSGTITTTIGSSASASGSDSGGESSAGDSSGSASASASASATMTTDASSEGGGSSSGGSACTPQDECMDDSMCNGGTCIECVCIGGGETGATMSDYGACDMCAMGETPIGIMGLDGFCFCAPGCDGAMSECPAPSSGGGTAVCGLGMDAMNPTLCVVLCMDDTMCPSGATCEELMTPQGTVGLCTHPAPM